MAQRGPHDSSSQSQSSNTASTPQPHHLFEGAAYYYQTWHKTNESGDCNYENTSARPLQIHREVAEKRISEENGHETSVLKNDITVLSVGQLRSIICRLIDLTDESSSASPATVQRADIAALVQQEINRLRGASNVHWNSQFQDALERKSNDKLTDLGDDFSFTANLYAQVLIMEKNLPNWQKTILPVEIGGFAGGTKYIAHGIVFKFASNDRKLYGSHHNAAKAVGADLRHAAAIREAVGSKLSVPIGVSIDWFGHRLSATSLLPLKGRASLVYGSSDAGRCIFDGSNDSGCEAVMEELGPSLGLRKHSVEDPKTSDKKARQHASSNGKMININKGNSDWTARTDAKIIYGPTDMEIHRADDNRLYALDCHRLFPCEAPVRELRPKEATWPKCGHLVRLLRPEFVKAYSHTQQVYFSSDAFSKFAAPETADLDASEVVAATKYLLLEHVPAFAKHLDASWLQQISSSSISSNEGIDAESNKHTKLSDSDQRAQLMLSFLSSIRNDAHGHGINMRLLGYVRRASRQPVVRALLLVEMLARTAKAEVRETLRKSMGKSTILPSGSGLRSCIVRHLNLLLGAGKSSREYWEIDLRKSLESKFEYATLQNSLEDGVTDNDGVYISSLKIELIMALQTASRRLFLNSLLWVRLRSMLGIEVLPRTHYELLNEDSPYFNNGGSQRGVLLDSEIISIDSRLKSPPVLTRAAAHMLLEHATTVSRHKILVTDTLPPLPSDYNNSEDSLKKRNIRVTAGLNKQIPTQNWQAMRLFRLASLKALQSLDRAPTSCDGLSLLGETQLREAAQTLHTLDALRLLQSAHDLLCKAQERSSTHDNVIVSSAPSIVRSKILGFSVRCALLAAVAKVRLACIGHEPLEKKRMLLLDACSVLRSRSVDQWMEAQRMKECTELELSVQESKAKAHSNISHEQPTYFTNDITDVLKIAFEHLLALFHLGCLEACDEFFADSGIARLHKALGVLRLGKPTSLRQTPVGLLLESHIRAVIGVISCPISQQAIKKKTSASSPILLLKQCRARPASAVLNTSANSCGVFRFLDSLTSTCSLNKQNSVEKNLVSGSELPSHDSGNTSNTHVIAANPDVTANFRGKVKCMCLMHGERILVCANEKQEMIFVDLHDKGAKIRNKVITGTSEEITVMAAHEAILAVGTGNGMIRVLSVKGGEHLNRNGLPLPVHIDLVLTGHSSNVMAMDLQDGGHLISGGIDRSVRVWDLSTGALIVSLTRRWPGWGPIYSIALLSAPLGTRCAIKEETEIEAKDDVAINQSASAQDNHLSSGRKRAVAVSSGDGGLRLWSLTSLIRSDKISEEISSKGEEAGAAAEQNKLMIRRQSFVNASSSCSRILVEPGKNPLFGKDYSVVVTKIDEVDNSYLFVTGNSKGCVSVWDEISWVQLRTIQAHTNAVVSLCVSQVVVSKLVKEHAHLETDANSRQDILTIMSSGSGDRKIILNILRLGT